MAGFSLSKNSSLKVSSLRGLQRGVLTGRFGAKLRNIFLQRSYARSPVWRLFITNISIWCPIKNFIAFFLHFIREFVEYFPWFYKQTKITFEFPVYIHERDHIIGTLNFTIYIFTHKRNCSSQLFSYVCSCYIYMYIYKLFVLCIHIYI